MSEGKEKVNGMFGVSSKAWKCVWKTGKAAEIQVATLPLTGIAVLLPELTQWAAASISVLAPIVLFVILSSG